MTENKEFIKIGERIVVKPKGADYSLIPGKTYSLEWDDWQGEPIFKENGELNLPNKIYQSTKDEFFKRRIFSYFNTVSNNTTGVLLAGTKGTGKSVTAKIIAKESNLPIIIVSATYPARRLMKFFKHFTTPVCVIFDEVEKNYNTEHMLEFLDGIEKTAKKLILMTCNNINKISEYMQDRCSRIRYLRKYTEEENVTFLPMLVEDIGIKEERKKEVIEFCKNHIALLSMDNLVSFLNEVKLLEDENIDLFDIVSIMNISIKGSKPVETAKENSLNSVKLEPEESYYDGKGFDFNDD